MASINTQFNMYDRMSAPLESMVKSLNSILDTLDSVDKKIDPAFNSSAVRAASAQIDLAEQEFSQLNTELQRVEQSQAQVNKQMRSGATTASSLDSSITGLVGAYVGFQTIGSAVRMSDSMAQTEARLNMINDGLQTTEQLQDMIYTSAERSRALYTTTSSTVAQLAQRAGDVFDSNKQTIQFAENLNKMFVIAGASQMETESATLQLTQALGSGVLRGEELNAIFEAAPNIVQTIADHLNVSIGAIRDMASEGEITAETVKSAMLGATSEINAQFEEMPMTWAQVWNGVMNEIVAMSQPVLSFISMLAQNWATLEPILYSLVTAIGIYLAVLGTYKSVTMAAAAAQSILAAGKMFFTGATFAATVAQHGFNAALLAFPGTWIALAIVGIIAAVYAFVEVFNKATGSTVSGTGVILGAFAVMGAGIVNTLYAAAELIFGILEFIVNPFLDVANFIGNVFKDPIASVIYLFQGMADSVLGILEAIASSIDFLFGTNLASSVAGWRSDLKGFADSLAQDYGNGTYEDVIDAFNMSLGDFGVERIAYSDAYDAGYKLGESIDHAIGDMFTAEDIDIPSPDDYSGGSPYDPINPNDPNDYAAQTAYNTAGINDAVTASEEDLKYLRDIAERDVINRFTTAEISVEMTNNNNVNSAMDIDGIVDRLTTGVNEAMSIAAEGSAV